MITRTLVDGVRGNFKQVLWSPDSSLLLATNEDASSTVYTPEGQALSRYKASASVSDVAWFPWMRSGFAGSNCYLAAISGDPLKLIDGETGMTRSVYKTMNHLDELDPCVSCAFSPDGQQVFGGSRERIYQFDVNKLEQSVIKTKENRRARDGQAGVISCVTPRWDDTGVLGAGSFSGTIGIYDTRAAEPLVLHLKPGIYQGITQVKFDPHDGMKLYAGARHSDVISCWDLRTGDLASSIPRPSQTNQRLYFSITSDGTYLISGVSDVPGEIIIHNLETSDQSRLRPHTDSASAVSCHPRDPKLIAACSGQRHPIGEPDNSIRIVSL